MQKTLDVLRVVLVYAKVHALLDARVARGRVVACAITAITPVHLHAATIAREDVAIVLQAVEQAVQKIATTHVLGVAQAAVLALAKDGVLAAHNTTRSNFGQK